tara:strand:- start:4667 stop:4828 length:162 start_codon:yes stop_codon:yes gene_type:complete
MFFFFASAFIADNVSFNPFASRYASTAGTKSAAFALMFLGRKQQCGATVRPGG